MALQGLVCKHTPPKYRVKAGPVGKAPNILDRNFNPEYPNTVWATDVTYLRVWGTWIYLCVFIDLYDRSVRGWAMSTKVDTKLVLAALQSALGRSEYPTGVLIHSDQGSTYTALGFVDTLDEANLKQSMSRRGNCWDNACAESFFKTIKIEMDHNVWGTYDACYCEVFEYIENFYNTRRSHSSLKYKTPNQARMFALENMSSTVENTQENILEKTAN